MYSWPRPGGAGRYAGRDRRVVGGLRGDLHVEAHERGVDRARGRPPQVDHAVGAPALVGDLRARAQDLGIDERAVAVDRGLRRDALLQGRDERERLEGRPGRNLGVGCRGELPGLVVLAAVHGHDCPVGRPHGDQPGIHVVDPGLGEVVVHRRDGRVLRRLADRRGDPQTALVDVLVGELELALQLVAHRCDDVAVGARQDARGGFRLDGRHGRGGALGRREPALGNHAIEHVVEPGLQVGLLLRAEGRVVEGGRVDDRGEHRPLGNGELADVLVEVGARRRLDAVSAPPVVDRVEVALQDLVLGAVPVDLDGDDELADLAVCGAVLVEEVVLDVLLGDRRAAALHLGAAKGLPDRAGDPADGDALVGVEVAVLRGDHRLADLLGNGGQGNRLAVLFGHPGHLGLAVVVVDDGGLGVGQLVRVRHLHQREGDRPRHDREPDEREQGQQDPADPPAGGRAALGLGRSVAHGGRGSFRGQGKRARRWVVGRCIRSARASTQYACRLCQTIIAPDS